MEDVYVYVDKRADNLMPFYVGKGKFTRVRDLKRNKLHQRISAKYGVIREIVCGPVSDDEAKSEEIRLIKELKTFVKEGTGGANFTLGGDGVSGYKLLGRHHSKETRDKQSKASKGRKKSPTHCKNIGLSKRGIVHSEKSKQNMRKSHEHMRKAVVQFDLDGNFVREFSTARDAANTIGCASWYIGRCCRGGRKKYKGYIWKYKDDICDNSDKSN